MKLLVAGNDKNVCQTLKKSLEKNNYTVDTAADEDEIFALLDHIPYDAVIMDNALSGKDSIEIIADMRNRKVVIPIVVMSDKAEVEDKVRTLDAGADDYLTKPFAISELMARLRAILRRGGVYIKTELEIGNLRLNCSGNVLYTEMGSFDMNNKEFQIIEYFMRNPGKTFSTEELMARFWGWDSDSAVNVVWTNIANLRRKLKKLNANVKISSIRGVGYKLESI